MDLSFNKLRNLTFEEPLPNLNEIYLAHNDIADISWESFVDLKNLSLLDLSYNNLSVVDSQIISNIKSGLEFKFEGKLNFYDVFYYSYSNVIVLQTTLLFAIVHFGHFLGSSMKININSTWKTLFATDHRHCLANNLVLLKPNS